MTACVRDDSTECTCERCLAADDAFWLEQGDGGGMPQMPPHPDDDTAPRGTCAMDELVEHAYKRERDEARREVAELRREIVVLQRKLAEQQHQINRQRGNRQ